MFAKLLFVVLFIESILATSAPSNHSQIRDRIAYGEKTKWHNFPYMVSLRERERIDGREHFTHFCGGALISSRLVLSAQHCFWNSKHLYYFEDMRIVVGANYVAGGGQSYRVRTTINHFGFDYENSLNDLIFIKTDTPVEFNNIIQPIAISKKWIEPGQVVVFSGFGFTVTGQNKKRLHLQSFKLKVISNDECIRLNKPEERIKINNSTLCTYNKNEITPLHGDSGGPLIINYQLVGISSWGRNEFGFPSAYVRLSEYSEWIEEIRSLYDDF